MKKLYIFLFQRTRFETEQQNQFQGIDASKHHRPALILKEDEYKPNTEGAKFEAISHVQVYILYKPVLNGLLTLIQSFSHNVLITALHYFKTV